jgi:hypothetical protein
MRTIKSVNHLTDEMRKSFSGFIFFDFYYEIKYNMFV